VNMARGISAAPVPKRILLKSCPRCRGDLIREDGLGDEFAYTCLQCGRTLEGEQLRQFLEKLQAA